MYQINMKRVSNPVSFLSKVDSSKGEVFICLPNNTWCNLKQDETARLLLQMMKPSEVDFTMALSDFTDFRSFISYLADASKAS